MRVRDLMVRNGLLRAREEDSLALAAQMMAWGRVRHLPVMRQDELVGVLSERDLLLQREKGDGVLRWQDVPVRQAMSAPPVVASPDQELAQASAQMTARRIGCLPVLEAGVLVGIITTTDIVRAASGDLFVEREELQRSIRRAMREDVCAVHPDDELLDAVDTMVARGVRHLPVVDERRRLVGMLSDRDVWMAVADPTRPLEAYPAREGRFKVSSAMTPNPAAVRADASMAVAVRQLLARRVGTLPVVDQEERLVGLVSYLDILQALRRI